MANPIEVRRGNRTPSTFGSFPEFEDLFDQFVNNRMMNSLFSDMQMPALSRPAIEVDETDDAFIVSAELPGIPADALKVNVEGNVLTIQAAHTQSEGEEGDAARPGRGFRRQFRQFRHSFSVPSTIDASRIEAHYENGLLEVNLPKTAEVQPKRIEVKTGAGGFLSRALKRREESQKIEGQSQKKKH